MDGGYNNSSFCQFGKLYFKVDNCRVLEGIQEQKIDQNMKKML